MNKKQMLEIIKQKGLLEQGRNLSKKRKQRNGNEVKLVDVSTGESPVELVQLVVIEHHQKVEL